MSDSLTNPHVCEATNYDIVAGECQQASDHLVNPVDPSGTIAAAASVPRSNHQFVDLNDDCIIAILNRLSSDELSAVASTCIRLSELARIAFKSKKSFKRLNILALIKKYEPNEIAFIRQYLHNFGEFIDDIDFSYSPSIWGINVIYHKVADRNRIIFNGIVTYCADSLQKLHLGNIYMVLAAPHNAERSHYFPHLTALHVNHCYDLTMNSAWPQYLETKVKSWEFRRECMNDYAANYLNYLPNSATLTELTISNGALNYNTIEALSHHIELRKLHLIHIAGICNQGVRLLQHLTEINELFVQYAHYNYLSKLLVNLGSTDALERLTIKNFYTDTEFFTGFKRFRNLRSLHFGYLSQFDANRFRLLDNLSDIREFVMDQWNEREIMVDGLVDIIRKMDNLEILQILFDIDGTGDDWDEDATDEINGFNDDTFMQLANMYRQRRRKLIIKYHPLYEFNISDENLVKHWDFVEMQKIDAKKYVGNNGANVLRQILF